MGKEVKVGLAVIGTLLIVFAGAVYLRLTGSNLLPVARRTSGNDANAPPDRSKLLEELAEKGRALAAQGEKRNWVRPAEPEDGNQQPDVAVRGEHAPSPFLPAGLTSLSAESTETSEMAREHAEIAASDENRIDDRAYGGEAGGESPGDQQARTREGKTEGNPLRPTREPNLLDQNMETASDRPASPRGANVFESRAGKREAADPPREAQRQTHYDRAVRPTQALTPPPRFDDSALENPSAAADAGNSDPNPGHLEATPRGLDGETRASDSDFASPRSSEDPRESEPEADTRSASGESDLALPPERFVPDDRSSETAEVSEPTSRLVSAPPVTRQRRVDASSGKYLVQPNDTFWIISEKVYGTGGYFKALYEHNRRKFPREDQLRIGDELAAPPAMVLEQSYRKLCPKPRRLPAAQGIAMAASASKRVGGKVYVVEEGDTLFDIARYELGKAGRWTEIYDLNRDLLGDDFDFLQPGTELVMPTAKDDADILTRQNDNTYQR